jgi:hypothetical protein
MKRLSSYPPRLAFTEKDANKAFEEWGCNCGPGSLAAIIGKTLDEVRYHIPKFEERKYTNPKMMYKALNNLKIKYDNSSNIFFPRYGLARIQWDGPWMASHIPEYRKWRHTHWIGSCIRTLDNIGIFDINAINSGGWISLDSWESVIVPHILSECEPNSTGKWSITHSLEIFGYE